MDDLNIKDKFYIMVIVAGLLLIAQFISCVHSHRFEGGLRLSIESAKAQAYGEEEVEPQFFDRVMIRNQITIAWVVVGFKNVIHGLILMSIYKWADKVVRWVHEHMNKG